MQFLRKRMIHLFTLVLLLSACSPVVANRPEKELEIQPGADAAAMDDGKSSDMLTGEGEADMATAESPAMEKPDTDMAEEDNETMPNIGTDNSMSSSDNMEVPDWFNAELTNVASEEILSIEDLKGKVILIETMAVWCSNCLTQQRNVLQLHSQLGERDDFVTLVLDIDPNEDAEMLKDYITRNGFPFTYAIAPVEVARALANLYGDQFLNPPSTPMLIIDRSGSVHPLPFGMKSADKLQEALQPFLDQDM